MKDIALRMMEAEEDRSVGDVLDELHELAYMGADDVARRLQTMNPQELESAVVTLRAGRSYDPLIPVGMGAVGLVGGMLAQATVDYRLTECLPTGGNLAGLLPLAIGLGATKTSLPVRAGLTVLGGAMLAGGWMYAQQNPRTQGDES